MTRRRHHKRRLRWVPVLPSVVTLINALCGFTAIHLTAAAHEDPFALWWEKPQLTYFAAAAFLIFFGMIADALDGRLARMSNATSDFGEQLDSLCDTVTFGVAPAFLMLRVVECDLIESIGPTSPVFAQMPGKLIWSIAAAYVCCTLLRLARFNIETDRDESSHMFFSGLPTPAAAGVIAALVLLWGDLLPQLQKDVSPALVVALMKGIVYSLPVITLALALLMVSRIAYPHIINQYLRGKRSFRHVVLVVLALLGLFWQLQLTLTICFLGFAGSGAVRWFWRKYIRKTTIAASSTSSPARTTSDVPNADKKSLNHDET